MDRLSFLLVACCFAACSTPNAVLLTVRADAKVEQYDLYVRQDSTSQIVFHSGFNAVQTPNEKARDLTKDGLRIALKMNVAGNYTLLMVGVIGETAMGKPAPGATQLFWAGHVHVDGTVERSVKLLTVPDGDDADHDLWPDAVKFTEENAEAGAAYRDHMDLLDCADDPMAMLVDTDGNPIRFKAEDINPFAIEVCEDGFDEDCNGNGDEKCVDADHDGDPSVSDCDDKDPKRHRPTMADPFPDPPNCCGYSLGKKGTADEHKDFTGDPTLCPMKRCDDGIDESCQGKDTTCIIDADCDGDPAKPVGNDCDDNDPAVHFGALEPCGSTKDLNCDGVVNGGCVPCDLDGDGFQRNDPANGCPDDKNKNPGKFDCNDYDAAVFPGATTNCGGTEAGMTSIGRLTCSLRQFCRTVYEPTGMTGTAKVPALGWKVGDMDCNGTAYEGCPPANCDADGDGWPTSANGCAAVDGKFDCDDTNPTIYPGAPKSCGSGPSEDCTTDKDPCTSDADGDGWNAGADCDDGDATVHPWAIELCDGKDNDCDLLVDEGNPDVTGKPMVQSGAVTSCTDSNLGECPKTKGVCVCAIALPMSTTNPGNRMICPTEDSGSAKPPHCFGAGQPHPQSCNHDDPKDDDCNGTLDDTAGANLAVKGMPCGIMGPGAVSICRPGVVVGCDTAQVNCFAAFGRIPMSQAWYVCSAEAVCPHAEECNGLDDDCNGAPLTMTMPPDPDENDVDGDHYLACAGCGGLTMAPGVKGCNDCDDTRSDVYPGAPEKCDSRNNACDPAWALAPGGTDGKDECGMTGTTPNCCSNENTCRNTTKGDVNHCGGCTASNVCSLLRNNQCTNSGCVCGQAMNSTTCPVDMTSGNASFWCNAANNSGTCEACTTNVHCGPNCVDCGSMAVCKTDKTGCTGCNIDGDCQSRMAGTYCNTGVCQACQVNVRCGNPSCTDCTLQSSNKICVNNGGNYQCGCTMNNQCNSGEYCMGLGCAACTVDAHCATGVAACTNCTMLASNKVCVNNGGNFVCGCTGSGNGGACASTEYCKSQACTTCNTFDHCSTGSGCADCTNNNNGHLCKNQGQAQPCGCTDDSNCPTGYFCNGTTCSQCTVDAHCGYPGACGGCGASTNKSCINFGGSGNYQCGCSGSGNGGSCAATEFCSSQACTACNTAGHCATMSGCVNCALPDPNGNKCTTAGNAQPCGCTTVGAGGDCGATQLCSTGHCITCATNALCSNGSTCITCSGNTPKCRAAGSGTPCGCDVDGDCGGTQFCNTATHTCQNCGIGSPCTGNCATHCPTDYYCDGATCTACHADGTPCGGGQACVGNCGGGRYCNTNMCATCGNSDPAHCGGSCLVCSGDTPSCSGGACQCTSEGDCTPANKYCKSTVPPSCASRIPANTACAGGNCAFAGCLQCTFSSGSTCPGANICRCTADADCPANQYCDTVGNNQCKNCATNAPCGGGRHCADGNCGNNNYCGSGSTCTSCVTNGDDNHCGAGCSACGVTQYCAANNGTNQCQGSAPSASPCPIGVANGCSPGNGIDCLRCLNQAGTTHQLCGVGINCP